MNCSPLPNFCRMDFCQACDLFPVDMGINLAPLQEKINECKRRYHREVWQILCDGAKQQSGGGGSGSGVSNISKSKKVSSWQRKEDPLEVDDDADDADSYVSSTEDDVVMGSSLDRLTRNKQNKGTHYPLSRFPSSRGGDRVGKAAKDKSLNNSTTQTSSKTQSIGGSGRRRQRRQHSVSFGGGSNLTPIAGHLDRLRTALERSRCSSGSNGGKSAKKASPTSLNSTTTAATVETTTATGSGSSKEQRDPKAHTLEFTIIADGSTRETIRASGSNSFRTVTVTDTRAKTAASFVPLLCGNWGRPQPPTPTPTATATTTAETKAMTPMTSSRQGRRPRSRQWRQSQLSMAVKVSEVSSGCCDKS